MCIRMKTSIDLVSSRNFSTGGDVAISSERIGARFRDCQEPGLAEVRRVDLRITRSFLFINDKKGCYVSRNSRELNPFLESVIILVSIYQSLVSVRNQSCNFNALDQSLNGFCAAKIVDEEANCFGKNVELSGQSIYYSFFVDILQVVFVQRFKIQVNLETKYLMLISYKCFFCCVL